MPELNGEVLGLVALVVAALLARWIESLTSRRRRSNAPRRRSAAARDGRKSHSGQAKSPEPVVPHKPDLPAVPAPRPPPPFSGRVWVIDGDTIVVGKARIRLFGMDAPEMDQRGGSRAKWALVELCRKQSVTVEPLSFDCYDRIVAKVWLGDTDLSERMVRDGFAVATSRWNRDYLTAEREARAGRRGLWRDCADRGITDPAVHRAAKRGRAEADPAGKPPVRPWPN